MENKINKVLITQPNYSLFGKRIWKIIPYTLGILNASIKNQFKTELFDPSFDNVNDETIIEYLKKSSPDVVAISTVSTEYLPQTEHMTELVRKALPNAMVIEGGIIPTVSINWAIKDKNVDYWVMGEGEFRLPALLEELNKENPDFSTLDGLAYYKEGKPIIIPPKKFIDNLDTVPFPNYGNLNLSEYTNQLIKYSPQIIPRKFPFILTSSSRGCPFNCIFCSGWTVTGKKVRMRSVENVLKEIDHWYNLGIKEIVFLDDHFLFSRERAINIMKGLIERKYDLLWKCVNVTVQMLDEEILNLMKESGCYQITVSIESGNQEVLNKIIKKPINLEKVPSILNLAKNKGFEVISNFIIGFPHETFEQIRDTFAFAEKINIDLVNFHIATPLPKTELMEICIKERYLPDETSVLKNVGFCQPIISTNEFTIEELQILRAFEWDRINFSSKDKIKNVARIEGLTLDELDTWRRNTRSKLGVKVV